MDNVKEAVLWMFISLLSVAAFSYTPESSIAAERMSSLTIQLTSWAFLFLAVTTILLSGLTMMKRGGKNGENK